MTNLKNRIKKLELAKNNEDMTIIIVNSLSMYKKEDGLPFIQQLDEGFRLIHCLAGQDISHLKDQEPLSNEECRIWEI